MSAEQEPIPTPDPVPPVEPTPPPPPPPPPVYNLVVVHEESGNIGVEVFTGEHGRSDLVGRLRKLVQQGGRRVFVFEGRRLGISKPPYRYLIDGKEQIPLFEIKLDVEEDETGSLDNAPEMEQDPVYRAITRKGLDDSDNQEYNPLVGPGLSQSLPSSSQEEQEVQPGFDNLPPAEEEEES